MLFELRKSRKYWTFILYIHFTYNNNEIIFPFELAISRENWLIIFDFSSVIKGASLQLWTFDFTIKHKLQRVCVQQHYISRFGGLWVNIEKKNFSYTTLGTLLNNFVIYDYNHLISCIVTLVRIRYSCIERVKLLSLC